MNKEIPIIFILSRYNPNRDLEYQFDYFFESLLPYIDQKDKQWIVLDDSDSIKFARREGKTVFELSYDNINYKEIIKRAIKKNKSQEKIRELSKKHKIFKESIEYRNNILIPAFNKLRKIIQSNKE